MFINGLQVSSLFFYTDLLYLYQCLPAHIPYSLCSSTPYPLCAISLLCTIPLLCILVVALYLLLHTSITLHSYSYTSLLYSAYIWSLFLLCILCHHASACSLMSSTLPVHHCNSSASLEVRSICQLPL
jgi:hypothetical protein